MIVALDVDYGTSVTVTAVVGFDAWSDAAAEVERVFRSGAAPAAYEPGAFYKRELPGLRTAPGGR